MNQFKWGNPIELAFVLCIILLAIGIFAAQSVQITKKTKSTEGWLQLRAIQSETVDRFATTGVLEVTSNDDWSGGYGKNVGRWSVSNGIVTATQPTFNDAILAYEPSVVLNQPAGSIQWNCGNNKPMPGWSGKIKPQDTTMKKSDMPHTCRSGVN